MQCLLWVETDLVLLRLKLVVNVKVVEYECKMGMLCGCQRSLCVLQAKYLQARKQREQQVGDEIKLVFNKALDVCPR